jgi:hypothetical protein
MNTIVFNQTTTHVIKKCGEFFDEIVSPPRKRNKKVISIENVIIPSESGSELH